MKKLLLILSLILIVGTISAQNEWKNLVKLYGGVQIGRNGTGIGSTFVLNAYSKVGPLDSIAFDNLTTPTTFKVYRKGVQQIPDIPAAGYIDAYTYLARKYLTDTLLVTDATYSLVAADAGRVIYCNRATFQQITIPANATTAIPVGTIITFIKTGAGVVGVLPAANVVRKSVLDSTWMNTVNQTYQIVQRAANKWYYIGDWRD